MFEINMMELRDYECIIATATQSELMDNRFAFEAVVIRVVEEMRG